MAKRREGVASTGARMNAANRRFDSGARFEPGDASVEISGAEEQVINGVAGNGWSGHRSPRGQMPGAERRTDAHEPFPPGHGFSDVKSAESFASAVADTIARAKLGPAEPDLDAQQRSRRRLRSRACD